MSLVAKPNTFSPNTTISSSAVNNNFDVIYDDYNGGISAANLASSAVTTAKIADSNVTTAKIADSSVTTAKIADAAVTPAKLLAGTGTSWAWQSWTPTFVNISGGTLNYAKYIQAGKTVHFRFKYTMAGAGVSGAPTFTLPVATHADYVSANESISAEVVYLDNGTNNIRGALQWATSTTMTLVALNTAATYILTNNLSSTVPMTWASGDFIQVSGTYEAA